MTRRRRKFPGYDHHALSVMACAREMALHEAHVDRIADLIRKTEAIIASGKAAGLDRSAEENLLTDQRDRFREAEGLLAMMERAAGIDPRPPRVLCPIISEHLDSLGLEDLSHDARGHAL